MRTCIARLLFMIYFLSWGRLVTFVLDLCTGEALWNSVVGRSVMDWYVTTLPQLLPSGISPQVRVWTTLADWFVSAALGLLGGLVLTARSKDKTKRLAGASLLALYIIGWVVFLHKRGAAQLAVLSTITGPN